MIGCTLRLLCSFEEIDMKTNIGEVVLCKHCNGNAKCNCYVCLREYGISVNPQSAAERMPEFSNIPCSVCRGVGKFWVGPTVVTVVKDSNEKK